LSYYSPHDNTGRLRWKIENEGLNTLKNGDYGLARKNYQALKKLLSIYADGLID
jgi:hypothetical protein